MDTDFDIVIVGAGPAGSTFVMALEGSGLKIAMVDKSFFPRDKVCGDAIPGKAGKVLESISPFHSESLENFKKKTTIWRARAVAPDFSSFDITFTRNGYAATRMDFDNHLLELAKRNSDCTLLLGEKVERVIANDESAMVEFSDGAVVRTRLVVGCDGAHSIVNKELAKTTMNKNHHCGAVRAYYQNVEGLESDLLEFYLLKDFLPGYFWIFPLHDGSCNVGFGMLSKDVSNREIRLMEVIPKIIQNTQLNERFEYAEITGPIKGFGLPMGSRKVPLSGNRFMLCGDAGSLIEPATGEGIGTAMLSAKIAADHAKQCFVQDDFSQAKMAEYDERVYGELWKELRTKYWIQKLLSNRPGLITFFIKQAGYNPLVRRLIQLL